VNKNQNFREEKYSRQLVRQELLLQLGVSEMQKEILTENNHLDFGQLLKLIEQKQAAIKNAFKNYSEGDILLYRVHLNHSMLIEEELKTQLDEDN
jgi:hypothetical protein